MAAIIRGSNMRGTVALYASLPSSIHEKTCVTQDCPSIKAITRNNLNTPTTFSRQHLPSDTTSGTAHTDFADVENGATIDASLSDNHRPTCAALNEAQSLPPSPHIPTTALCLSCQVFTISTLPCGGNLPKTKVLGKIASSSQSSTQYFNF